MRASKQADVLITYSTSAFSWTGVGECCLDEHISILNTSQNTENKRLIKEFKTAHKTKRKEMVKTYQVVI